MRVLPVFSGLLVHGSDCLAQILAKLWALAAADEVDLAAKGHPAIQCHSIHLRQIDYIGATYCDHDAGAAGPKRWWYMQSDFSAVRELLSAPRTALRCR